MRPINYVKIITVTTAVLGLITFFSVAAPYILPIIQNRNLWAAFSLIAVLLFTSGQMFNHIRKVPYVSGGPGGTVTYFAGGFQNQFGLETQVVAAMCKPRFPLFRRWQDDTADILNRWRVGFRNHLPRPQSPPHDGPALAANRRFHLGSRHLGNVLVPAERVPDQERRVSVLAAAVLDAMSGAMSIRGLERM